MRSLHVLVTVRMYVDNARKKKEKGPVTGPGTLAQVTGEKFIIEMNYFPAGYKNLRHKCSQPT